MNYLKNTVKVIFALSVLFFAGCKSLTVKNGGDMKFDRLFCWASPTTEANAQRYASAGVTDIVVRSAKQYDLAKKYDMTAYWKVFLPVGPHKQVLSPEEQKHFEYVSGADLDPKMPRAERMKILHKRRIEKQDRYGGDVVTEVATLNSYQIACFSSDDGLVLSQKAIDKMLKDAPDGIAGIFMDFIGYRNHKGCCCQRCLQKYQKYLSDNKLVDTPGNKANFYRTEMVNYYNNIVDYVKSQKPDYKVVVHVYPYFTAEPLYGNRTKVDYCGQTVSWYFKWDEATIRKKTEYVVKHAKDHFSNAEGVPFIGLSTDRTSSLMYKTPEEVDFELRTILSAGGRSVMVCYGTAILEDGYYEVFKKYCGKPQKTEK